MRAKIALIVALACWATWEAPAEAKHFDPYCGDGICQTDGCPMGGSGPGGVNPGNGCDEATWGCDADCGSSGGCVPDMVGVVDTIWGQSQSVDCDPPSPVNPAEEGCSCHMLYRASVHHYDENNCEGSASYYSCELIAADYYSGVDSNFCCDTFGCGGLTYCPGIP